MPKQMALLSMAINITKMYKKRKDHDLFLLTSNLYSVATPAFRLSKIN